MSIGPYWKAGCLGALALTLGLPVAGALAQKQKFGRRPSQQSGGPGNPMGNISEQLALDVRAALKDEFAKQAEANREESDDPRSDIKPLDFSELAKRLPSMVSDLPRVRVGGGNLDGIGASVTQAEANYANADRRRQVKISIYDVGGGLPDFALEDVQQVMSSNVNRESDEGYERSREIDGFKAVEKLHRPTQTGEIGVVVSDRIGVKVEGKGVPMSTIESAITALNLPDLARIGS